MITRQCAIENREITGKAYILATTEGHEIVSPEALFHKLADENLGDLLGSLQARIERLEEDVERANSDPIGSAAKEAAAPVKRTAKGGK